MEESISYIVSFERKDKQPDEEYFYNSESEAREHFDKFEDNDSGLYSSITLTEMDWYKRASWTLDSITFE